MAQNGPVRPLGNSSTTDCSRIRTVEISLCGGVNHILSVTGFHWTDYNHDGIIDASDNATIDVVDPWTAQMKPFLYGRPWRAAPSIPYTRAATPTIWPRVGKFCQAMVTCPTQWNSPGSAVWSSTSSWLGPVPDGPGAKANFLNSATAAHDGHARQFATRWAR